LPECYAKSTPSSDEVGREVNRILAKESLSLKFSEFEGIAGCSFISAGPKIDFGVHDENPFFGYIPY
jgi:hypothetical protein